jgi:hypothetical protein
LQATVTTLSCHGVTLAPCGTTLARDARGLPRRPSGPTGTHRPPLEPQMIATRPQAGPHVPRGRELCVRVRRCGRVRSPSWHSERRPATPSCHGALPNHQADPGGDGSVPGDPVEAAYLRETACGRPFERPLVGVTMIRDARKGGR